MRRCIIEDPIKFKLTVEHGIGSDGHFSNRPLTCIEFRLWRTSLRFLNINSVADLRQKEKGLVDWLTLNWFRILAKPKVKGHECEAPIHSLWIEVRAAFHRWFLGTGDDVPVEWKRPTAVSCPTPLFLKQGLGCIAKVAALMFGRQKRTEVLQKIFHSLLDSHLSLLSDKVNGIAGHLETLRGVRLTVKN